ncbi:MAG: M13 family metallopeptidase, partial [Erythrobacter sp.]
MTYRKSAFVGAKASVSAFALLAATTAIAAPAEQSMLLDTLVAEESATEAATQAASKAPVMTYGTWGIDPTTIDESVSPGENFFDYVNGKWVAENTIPADKGRYGSFDALREVSRADVKTLINELTSQEPASLNGDEKRIVDAYNAFLDVEAIDASGLAPAQPYLGKIFGAETLDDLVKLFAKAEYPGLIGAGVTVDAKAPNTHAVSIGFGGMGLPDRDYYLVDNERNTKIRAAYLEYMEFVLGKAGYTDPASAARSVYAFEKKVAAIEWARTAMRNRDLTYNKVSPEELTALAGDFPINTLLGEMGLGDAPFYLAPQIPPSEEEAAELGLTEEMLGMIGSGTPGMMKLLTETDLATIKAYMAKSMLGGSASVLSSDLDKASFDFYGKVLGGREAQEPRWKRAIATTESQLGEVLGKVYAERYFPAESKAAMLDLVANLRVAQAEGIRANDWMTAETKTAALEKLEAFDTKIGYPDKFETYEGLEISTDPVANAISAAKWGTADNLSRLGQPVDKSEWFMLPQTVNAYYNPVFNEIVFPAAILQRPFFSIKNDPAVNYGAIGGVIGHEIGHGFDDQGAKYDGTGTLRNWWAEEDLARFTA